MRRSLVIPLVWIAASAIPAHAAADGRHPGHERRVAELRALEVRPGPASVRLTRSEAVIEVRPGRGFLTGAEARRFMRLTQGIEYPETEAVVIGGGRGFVFVERFDVGYVPVGDRAGVDPARLMAGIRAATARVNARRGAAMGGIEVVGWAEPPRLLGPGDGVRWAIRAVEDGRTTINAVVLRLGRRGYRKLTWVGAEAAHGTPPAAAGGLLDEVAGGHRYRPGHRHADHAAGDPVAPFDLAALVAATADGDAPPDDDGRMIAAAATAGLAPQAWPALLLAGWALGWLLVRARPRTPGRILSAAGSSQNKGHERDL